MFSTQGFLSLLTFTPDSNNPCATEGRSYRYRFFFLNGQGGYNLATPTGTFADYRSDAGAGVAQGAQLTSMESINDLTINGGGGGAGGPGVSNSSTANPVRTLNQNWKEQ